jgi:hypothetical protein
MDFPLTTQEETIIKAALEFANLKNVESVDQVLVMLGPAMLSSGSPLIQTIEEERIGAFVDDWAQLLKWLDTIGRRRPTKADRDHTWGSLRKVLTDTVHGDAVWHLTDDGTVSAAAHPRLDGVQACTAFAAALLLDRSRGLNRWVQRCELEECRRWFFDWKRTGAPKKFCSNQHAAKCRQIRFSQKRRRRAR